VARRDSESIKRTLEAHTAPAAPELVRVEEDGAVRCLSCGNRCLIAPGESGICRVRTNINGELRVPWNYVAGLHVDPIEKKPFFHALPGSEALSFGMLGCNLHCAFCQNWISSQTLRDPEAGASIHPTTADRLVRIAVAEHTPIMVSTYNEPLITSDWSAAIFRKAKAHGILCGYVSNGHASPEVLEFLRPALDLFKIDLKTFDPVNYRSLGCELRNVLDTIERVRAMGYWTEIVTLVVPGFSDSEDQLRGIAAFIAGISPDIPWHVTAFRPQYHSKDTAATTPADLDRAYAAGKEAGLHFVYAGNLPGSVGDRESTFCPGCGARLIHRVGFRVRENRIVKGACPECGASIPGVWEQPRPAPHRAARS